MSRARHIALPRRQRAFTLIEVLVAVLVLSVGLLGLAGLHGVSLKLNRGAALRTQASQLAYEITDAMRANR
ncbi:MAG: type IV pilus modification protein PilV, partial [Chromatiaceae bacterium]|nr:type IV pilus modification protein PilV [Chromatiaceae bacterium]